ncbi:DnaA ATPase domain-containing protein [Streptococcus equi]|uniref:DnaA ATPase domain-containing protein n=1 Tax=Streptococcus equi TaxID=1336 RepID=UPI0039C6E939
MIEQQHQGQQGYTEQAFQQLPTVQSDLNPKYSFDNFIQGDENRWAVAASIAVANTPGTPIILYLSGEVQVLVRPIF